MTVTLSALLVRSWHGQLAWKSTWMAVHGSGSAGGRWPQRLTSTRSATLNVLEYVWPSKAREADKPNCRGPCGSGHQGRAFSSTQMTDPRPVPHACERGARPGQCGHMEVTLTGTGAGLWAARPYTRLTREIPLLAGSPGGPSLRIRGHGWRSTRGNERGAERKGFIYARVATK